MEHEVTIPSPTVAETVITTPYVPGLELHLPPRTIVRDEEGKPVTRLGITPIPVDRPPFPLAKNVDVPVYFTVQPGSAYVRSYGAGGSGAWVVYPNYRRTSAPGQVLQFFHYDPEEKDWYVYGLGTVTPDGTQVVPDANTRLYEFTGAMLQTGDPVPGGGWTPGGPAGPIRWIRQPASLACTRRTCICPMSFLSRLRAPTTPRTRRWRGRSAAA